MSRQQKPAELNLCYFSTSTSTPPRGSSSTDIPGATPGGPSTASTSAPETPYDLHNDLHKRSFSLPRYGSACENIDPGQPEKAEVKASVQTTDAVILTPPRSSQNGEKIIPIKPLTPPAEDLSQVSDKSDEVTEVTKAFDPRKHLEAVTDCVLKDFFQETIETEVRKAAEPAPLHSTVVLNRSIPRSSGSTTPPSQQQAISLSSPFVTNAEETPKVINVPTLADLQAMLTEPYNATYYGGKIRQLFKGILAVQYSVIVSGTFAKLAYDHAGNDVAKGDVYFATSVLSNFLQTIAFLNKFENFVLAAPDKGKLYLSCIVGGSFLALLTVVTAITLSFDGIASLFPNSPAFVLYICGGFVLNAFITRAYSGSDLFYKLITFLANQRSQSNSRGKISSDQKFLLDLIKYRRMLDNKNFQLTYDPTHPDAIYVQLYNKLESLGIKSHYTSMEILMGGLKRMPAMVLVMFSLALTPMWLRTSQLGLNRIHDGLGNNDFFTALAASSNNIFYGVSCEDFPGLVAKSATRFFKYLRKNFSAEGAGVICGVLGLILAGIAFGSGASMGYEADELLNATRNKTNSTNSPVIFPNAGSVAQDLIFSQSALLAVYVAVIATWASYLTMIMAGLIANGRGCLLFITAVADIAEKENISMGKALFRYLFPGFITPSIALPNFSVPEEMEAAMLSNEEKTALITTLKKGCDGIKITGIINLLGQVVSINELENARSIEVPQDLMEKLIPGYPKRFSQNHNTIKILGTTISPSDLADSLLHQSLQTPMKTAMRGVIVVTNQQNQPFAVAIEFTQTHKAHYTVSERAATEARKKWAVKPKAAPAAIPSLHMGRGNASERQGLLNPQKSDSQRFYNLFSTSRRKGMDPAESETGSVNYSSVGFP